VMAGMEPIMEN